MSIISIEQKYGQEGGDTSATLEYIVITDSVMNVNDLLEDTLMPEKGKRLSIGSSLVVVERSATRKEENPLVWDLTIQYGIKKSSVDTGDNSRLIAGPEYDTVIYQVVAEEGYFQGNSEDEGSNTDLVPILNSAGDKFSDPPMMEVRNLLIRWTQTERRTFDPVKVVQNINTIYFVTGQTDDEKKTISVLSYPLGNWEGFMRSIKPIRQADETYVCSYELEINTGKDFIIALQDMGFRYKNDAGDFVDIMNRDINPADYNTGGDRASEDAKVSDPQFLLPTGKIATDIDDSEKRLYRVYNFADWNTTLDLIKRL